MLYLTFLKNLSYFGFNGQITYKDEQMTAAQKKADLQEKVWRKSDKPSA